VKETAPKIENKEVSIVSEPVKPVIV